MAEIKQHKHKWAWQLCLKSNNPATEETEYVSIWRCVFKDCDEEVMQPIETVV